MAQRLESPILGLKSFNNWVKTVLITRFAHPVLANSKTRAVNGSDGHRGGWRARDNDMGVGKVLDMGCGKGGDMTKWAKARVKEFFAVGMITPASPRLVPCKLIRHLSSLQILQQYQWSKPGPDGSLSVGRDFLQRLPLWIAIPSH